MAETREFHIGGIISVMTGRLMSPGGIAAVHEFLDWLTSDTLLTHQLPRASRECEQPLRAQFPDLAVIEVPEELSGEEPCLAWLAEQVAAHGETRQVVRLSADDHTRINPFTEIRMINPAAEVIAFEVPDE